MGDPEDEGSEKHTCEVTGCDYSNDNENSMEMHALRSHENREAWKTGEDETGDNDPEPRADLGSVGGDDGPDFADRLKEVGDVMDQEPERETPNDILQRVLGMEPSLSDAQEDWLIERAKLEGVLAPADLREACHDLGLKNDTPSRVTSVYAKTINNRLREDPNLQTDPEWARLLTKETGDPSYVQNATQPQSNGMDTPGVIPPGSGGGGNGDTPGVVPPGQHRGGNGGANAGQSRPSIQPPQAGQNGHAQHQPASQPGHQMNGSVGPSMNGHSGSQANGEMEKIQEQQRMLFNVVRDLAEERGRGGGQGFNELEEALEFYERIDRMVDSDDGGQVDDQLINEIRQLRQDVATQNQDSGSTPANEMSALVELAREGQLEADQLDTMATALGVADTDVKMKELELMQSERKMERYGQMLEKTLDSLGDVGGDMVGAVFKNIAEGGSGGGGGGGGSSIQSGFNPPGAPASAPEQPASAQSPGDDWQSVPSPQRQEVDAEPPYLREKEPDEEAVEEAEG